MKKRSDRVLRDTFEKAKELWIKHDQAAMKAWLSDLETEAKQATDAYKPFSDQVTDFNKQADAYFAAEEAVKQRRRTPKTVAVYEVLSAVSLVWSVATVFAWATSVLGSLGMSNLLRVWLFFALTTVASSSMSLYLDGFSFKNKEHPFPKDGRKAAEAAAFKRYNDAIDAQTMVFAFSQIEIVSAFQTAYKKLVERCPDEAVRFSDDYTSAING